MTIWQQVSLGSIACSKTFLLYVDKPMKIHFMLTKQWNTNICMLTKQCRKRTLEVTLHDLSSFSDTRSAWSSCPPPSSSLGTARWSKSDKYHQYQISWKATLGGMNGRTMCAPGFGWSCVNSSSPSMESLVLLSSLVGMFFLFLPFVSSEGLRTWESPSPSISASSLPIMLFILSALFLLSTIRLWNKERSNLS